MQAFSHGSLVIISTVNQQDEVSGHADSVVSSKCWSIFIVHVLTIPLCLPNSTQYA